MKVRKFTVAEVRMAAGQAAQRIALYEQAIRQGRTKVKVLRQEALLAYQGAMIMGCVGFDSDGLARLEALLDREGEFSPFSLV